jgi:hypothetical protein
VIIGPPCLAAEGSVHAAMEKLETEMANQAGNPSSHGGDGMAETSSIACHELVSLDFRCGSQPEVNDDPENVSCWG